MEPDMWTNEELAVLCDEAALEAGRSLRGVPVADPVCGLYEADIAKFKEAARRLLACKCQDYTPSNAGSPERFAGFNEERRP